ncbi:MAG: Rrf2 family transcriptional regulator [Candidatus Binatia bacterium]
MPLLNNTCTYAIRAALEVATQRPVHGEFVSTRKVADDLAVPFAFLSKVLQGLTRSGILLSQRGATGGVALARAADTITLLDVLAAVGGDAVFRDCVLGLPTCSEVTPCALHTEWREQRGKLEVLFTSTTLADLTSGNRPPLVFDDPNPAASRKVGRPRKRKAT